MASPKPNKKTPKKSRPTQEEQLKQLAIGDLPTPKGEPKSETPKPPSGGQPPPRAKSKPKHKKPENPETEIPKPEKME